MPRQAKETFAILTPRNEAAKLRLEHCGERWVLRDTVSTIKFSREAGPWYVLRSRDGSKCLHVKQKDDKDFLVRTI